MLDETAFGPATAALVRVRNKPKLQTDSHAILG
jgi:hypothetical protein